MTIKKKITFTTIIIVSLIASNLIGGFIGFHKGFEAGLYLEGLSASSTVLMLEQLREAKTELPTEMLETKLDWQIYNIGTYNDSIGSIYSIHKYRSDIDSTKLANMAMKHAIKYRREIPSTFPDAGFRKTIYDILNKYEKSNQE